MKHTSYYVNNKKYSDIVEAQDPKFFSKYIDSILKYSNKFARVLDVGCGTGTVLMQISKVSTRIPYGIDISKTSIELCNKKKLNCQVYDGEKIPFANQTFGTVGSFDVLEHTDNPTSFLNEQYRVLKSGGYLLVACPNFLSITNNYHPHTSGFIQKIRNFLSFIEKKSSTKVTFEKMSITRREVFRPDDDAVNVTNPVDILKWGKLKKLSVLYWSCQLNYGSSWFNIIDKSDLRYFFGSSFIVFKK